jgi:hypothetical protein
MDSGMADYVPDPPSPRSGADGSSGTVVPPNRFSHVLTRPGYVSHPFYTTPPVWHVGPRTSYDEIVLASQRRANESGTPEHIIRQDGTTTVIEPVR